MKTNRKPHSDTAGYVTERKSKHPKLPGHFVIIDRQNGGDWIDGDNRWVVIHANGEKFGCMVTLPSCKAARDVMYHVAGGGDDVDFGQHEHPPCLVCGEYDPDHTPGCTLAPPPPEPAFRQYECSKQNIRLIVTVEDGIVTGAESPERPCFDANFVGAEWAALRKTFEADGFLIHGGN